MVKSFIGYYWNSQDIEIHKIDNKNIALNGWNGEIYGDCFELGNDLRTIKKGKYEVKPVYKLVFGEFRVVEYKII